ncbi:HET-domain-containing protein, partial [Sporormia fimetaria CBS 119925]
MWLINATSLTLSEFYDNDLPEYLILSHTWGADKDEVTFAEMRTIPRPDAVKDKSGYRKIVKTCEIALKDDLEYVWIDTCCIDKSSTAELSEAIGSMFRYYQGAKLCVAYLADWSGELSELGSSRWFTRGWTLQELIAPHTLYFYDRGWECRGGKFGLAEKVKQVTGISTQVLRGEKHRDTQPVAVRMSWAATRKTKRAEDIAYCLLGIFDINMPTLYGEGTKAFLRLQEEIIRQSTDMSIFAWKADERDTSYTGLLASSPALFRDLGGLYPQPIQYPAREYHVTNRGIRFEMSLMR